MQNCSTVTTLALDFDRLRSAFCEVEGSPLRGFLCRLTGEVIFVEDDDADLAPTDRTASGIPVIEHRELLAQIAANPARFLKIPTSPTPDCLAEFVRSNWSSDTGLVARTAAVYQRNGGRYRGFKDNAEPEAIAAFMAFQEQLQDEEVIEFLRENGIAMA